MKKETTATIMSMTMPALSRSTPAWSFTGPKSSQCQA